MCITRELVVHGPYHCHATCMGVVEGSVEVVKQLVANPEGGHGTLSYLGEAHLRPVARVLVSGAQCIVRPTVRVVGAQLKPSTAELGGGVHVVTANVSARLNDKGFLQSC